MENPSKTETLQSEVVVGLISRFNQGKKEYLLLSSKKDFGKFTGKYYPPGGHMEEGEDKMTTLKREIKEELGIDIEPVIEIATTPGDIKNQITYWWECKSPNIDFIVKQEEIADIRWFSEEEIKTSDLLWPATKKFFNEFVFSNK